MENRKARERGTKPNQTLGYRFWWNHSPIHFAYFGLSMPETWSEREIRGLLIALYNQQVIIHSPTMWEILHTYFSFFFSVPAYTHTVVCCQLPLLVLLVHVLLTAAAYGPILDRTYCLFFSSLICYTIYSFAFFDMHYVEWKDTDRHVCSCWSIR